MSQGSRSTRPINLDDDLIDQRLAKPQPIQLAGREFSVRRDLTAEEIYRFWGFVSVNDAGEALALLLSIPVPEAKELDAILQGLPAVMYVKKIHKLTQVAGLKRGDEKEDTAGESTPSSAGS